LYRWTGSWSEEQFQGGRLRLRLEETTSTMIESRHYPRVGVLAELEGV
jgi:hypothetical protein